LDEDKADQPRKYNVFLLNETVKNLAGREKIIAEWSSKRGVLLIGYEMYRMLALKKLKRPGSKKKNTASFQTLDEGKLKRDLEDELLLDKIHSCLVKPGPDLVICDEGHRIKNSGASISQALKAIKTRRRIVLTGENQH
jgi:RAD54-like protein 2